MPDHSKNKSSKWLPVNKKEAQSLGWNELDVVLISGDAYIDHPSFGIAIIARLLQSLGLKVAIVPQPNWQDDLRDFKKFGKPRLFFGVSSGSMDSMINHYTANKRIRSNDAYTPGGKSGFRPDYATIKYCNILKQLYPDCPIIIGGVEASLRRFAHYDYWSDSLKPSILIDSKADLLVYGMGEKPIKDIVKNLQNEKPVSSLKNIPQTAFKADLSEIERLKKEWNVHELNSFNNCLKDKKKHAENFKVIEEESNKYESKTCLIQKFKNDYIVVNPSYPPLTEEEIDAIYNLPFTRLPHPKYNKKESIPAYEMIRHSITIHRGCFGACSFCTISAHQGKYISSRSEKSILNEVNNVLIMHDFKGYISDLGGPSANMYKMQGFDLEKCKKCKRASCLYPSVCNNLDTDPQKLTELYKKVNSIHKIKKAFIGSGIRYDLFLHRINEKRYSDYAEELIKNHVSGRLKVAPEHTSSEVLKSMRKPDFSLFKKFKSLFDQINNKYKLNQQLIPYFISSHPGCKNMHMAELAIETKNLNFKLEQVQDFTPTPMTLSTVIYYSGVNPYTQKNVFTAKNKNEKLSQRKFFFWHKNEHKNDIIKELNKIKRPDLIQKLLNTKNKKRHR